MNFNIFSQLEKELDSFFNKKITIAKSLEIGGTKYLRGKNKDYDFSQNETLNTIDLYYNSKFQYGPYDTENQRKVFLNICKFRSDVASKMIDLDVKDFIFIPEESESVWPAWFLQKEFKIWTKQNKFGQLINELVIDLPKYGTAVVKSVGDEVVRVPLKNLRNPQDARSLDDAEWVIEEHEYCLAELKEYKDWDISGLEINYGDRIKVYERYGYVPESELYEGGDPEKEVKALFILTLNKKKNPKDKASGSVLFSAEIKEPPYKEVHWSKQDGRWLGIGEIENQFENQISRNILVNLRRRALLWNTKTIFQSPDDGLAKNLIKDVRDGDVLRISPNGNVTRVDNSNRSVSEFNSDESVWELNSNQKSFTFEVATGESLPSGSPFRLGVLLSNAVKSHFDLKRENFGLFLKDVVTELVIPVFNKKQGEHLVSIAADEEGVAQMREALINFYTREKIRDSLLNQAVLPDVETIKQKVTNDLENRPRLFFKIPKGFYDDLEYRIDLVITGEQIDTATKLETYKNIITLVAQNPQALENPNIKKLLKRIVALTGDNLDTLIGSVNTSQPSINLPSRVQQAMPQTANQSPLSMASLNQLL